MNLTQPSSSSDFKPIKERPPLNEYQAGDCLVLFGELFQRGYATGLAEEATRRGMTIIYSTVGRRDRDGSLRRLNTEEISKSPQPLINVPIEAGFDMEPDDNGKTPCDYLKDVKLSEWKTFKINESSIVQSRRKGRERFQSSLKEYVQELEKLIPPNARILFAHLMAGGVPRAKIVMPLMNRVFKGKGDRYLSSEEFWSSDIGKISSESFDEVTSETLQQLILATSALREKHSVSYVAYGYHGTEVLINGTYQWQTYSPYLQGWAKMKLENLAKENFKKGISVSVFNCPEILTNSSSIFQGVEVPLYPLLAALQKECPHSPVTQKVFEECRLLLKDGVSVDQILNISHQFLNHEISKKHFDFTHWPTHSSKEQLELLLDCSDQLIGLHKNEKQLITNNLSEIIFKACGYIMLNMATHPKFPVVWIGHDAVARSI